MKRSQCWQKNVHVTYPWSWSESTSNCACQAASPFVCMFLLHRSFAGEVGQLDQDLQKSCAFDQIKTCLGLLKLGEGFCLIKVADISRLGIMNHVQEELLIWEMAPSRVAGCVDFSFFCSSHLHQRNPWWIFRGRLHRFECYKSSRWSVWTWTTRNEAAPPAAATRWATAALARIWSLRSTLEALVDGILFIFYSENWWNLSKLPQVVDFFQLSDTAGAIWKKGPRNEITRK